MSNPPERSDRPNMGSRLDQKARENPYAHLDKLNPETQPNMYKAGLTGMGLGLLPIIVFLLWWALR